MKTLYFEGAGCVPRGEVENCRIRTAFRTDGGKAMYLEIYGEEIGKTSSPISKSHAPYGGWITDVCFIVNGKNGVEYEYVEKHNHIVIDYNRASILKFVNSLGCSFDDVVVLPSLAGYRVFGEKQGQHNFGDEFQYDPVRTVKSEEIRQYFYDLEESEGKKYPNFSLWVDEHNADLLHLLRHFNGYNREWIITICENWADTMSEIEIKKFNETVLFQRYDTKKIVADICAGDN